MSWGEKGNWGVWVKTCLDALMQGNLPLAVMKTPKGKESVRWEPDSRMEVLRALEAQAPKFGLGLI